MCSQNAHLKYRPEIDGLRALAVLPVVLFHAHVPGFSGGFVGVDIFFVISGFLITSIVAEEINDGRFSLVRFYERRIRRIVPALVLVSIACLPFAWAWMLPEEFADFGLSLIAVNLFVSNILFWQEASYFGNAAEFKPMLHTWTLAVEEQFYIFFPLLLILLRKASRRLTAGVIFFGIVVSCALAQWATWASPVAGFYLLPTRAFELGIGAFIYLTVGAKPITCGDRLAELGSLLGLSAIVGSIVLMTKTTPFPSVWTLIPTVGASLIIIFCREGTWVWRLLTIRFVVLIGLVSYSFYLWHQPLFAFARIRLAGDVPEWLFFTLSLVSLMLAYLSWRYVEAPFRRRASSSDLHFSRRQIFAGAIISAAALIGFGGLAVATHGLPQRAADPTVAALLSDRLRPNHGLASVCSQFQPDNPQCRTSGEPTVAVWGDSFAMHNVVALIETLPSNESIIQITQQVCGPILATAPLQAPTYTETFAQMCVARNDRALETIESYPSIRTVVLASPLRTYFEQGFYVNDRLVPPNREILASQIIATMDVIEATGRKAVFIEPPPRDGSDMGSCLARATWFGEELATCNISSVASAAYDRQVTDVIDMIEDHHDVIRTRDALCDSQVCTVSRGDTFFYRDASHLSVEGSRELGRMLNLGERVIADSGSRAETEDAQ